MIERDWNSAWWWCRQNSVSSASGSTGVSGRCVSTKSSARGDVASASRRSPSFDPKMAEQRHFVDAGGVGDAPRRGAARAVLGEDLERRFQQQFAGIHRHRA